MIEMVHNFDPNQFMWLWAKYVVGFNEKYHCTNSIRGRYSTKFNKSSPALTVSPSVQFDEQAWGSYRAIYVCGVSKRGYPKKQNYSHNVHAAILPEIGAEDQWSFENWRVTIQNGRFLTFRRPRSFCRNATAAYQTNTRLAASSGGQHATSAVRIAEYNDSGLPLQGCCKFRRARSLLSEKIDCIFNTLCLRSATGCPV